VDNVDDDLFANLELYANDELIADDFDLVNEQIVMNLNYTIEKETDVKFELR